MRVCVRADAAAAEFEIQNASNLILLSCKEEQEESKRERQSASGRWLWATGSGWPSVNVLLLDVGEKCVSR